MLQRRCRTRFKGGSDADSHALLGRKRRDRRNGLPSSRRVATHGSGRRGAQSGCRRLRRKRRVADKETNQDGVKRSRIERLARPRNSRNRQECRRRVIRRTRLSSSRLVQKPVVWAIGQLARPASSTNTPARSGAFERVWTTVVRAMFVGRSAGKGEVPAVGRPAASTDPGVSVRGRVAGAHSEGGRADLVRRGTRVRHPEW